MNNIINCPYCNAEMTQGVTEVKGNLRTFLFYGFSHMNLYFTHSFSGTNRKEKVMRCRMQHPGYWCPECKAVLVQGAPANRSKPEIPTRLLSQVPEPDTP